MTAVARPTCPQCQRPQSTCTCRFATPTPHATEVLILQHLSLPGSRLVVSEVFELRPCERCQGIPARCPPLLAAFDGFVTQQGEFMKNWPLAPE